MFSIFYEKNDVHPKKYRTLNAAITAAEKVHYFSIVDGDGYEVAYRYYTDNKIAYVDNRNFNDENEGDQDEP